MRCVIMAGLTKRIKDPFDYLKEHYQRPPFAYAARYWVCDGWTGTSNVHFLTHLQDTGLSFVVMLMDLFPLEFINKILFATSQILQRGVVNNLNGGKQKSVE